jgi:hypothetical protein
MTGKPSNPDGLKHFLDPNPKQQVQRKARMESFDESIGDFANG